MMMMMMITMITMMTMIMMMMMATMIMAYQHIPTSQIPTWWEYIIMMKDGNTQ